MKTFLIVILWMWVGTMIAGQSSSPAAAAIIQRAPGSLDALKPGSKATVLFFVAHDCPISNGYAPEMNRLESAYSAKGVRFYLIYAEKDLTPAQARAHYAAYAYRFSALLDPRFSLTREVHATVTPEAVVLDPKSHIVYHGAIDNLYADFGVKRQRATEFPLKTALDCILADRPIPASGVKDVGCYISTD